MQKQHRSSNWLVILMCAILAALSFWSIRILVTNTRGDSNETEYAKSIVNDQTVVSKQQTLLIGGDDSNPPYSYIQDGEALGLDNDLMREVAKNLGMKAVFNLSTLAEARQNLIDGKVDVIGGISFSQHQDENLLFGTSHAVQYYDLFVRQDSGISSISSMKDKIAIVIAGDEIINFLTQQGIAGQVVAAETPVEA
ncbi:MAG: transporter substrate-binding domain-containing protein, partial [Anaerolineaceae bacterium]|nr:transporter substrate-binding domain-containing protein [Anaerolineaceae bacterium]